jgi:hypothetical protein
LVFLWDVLVNELKVSRSVLIRTSEFPKSRLLGGLRRDLLDQQDDRSAQFYVSNSRECLHERQAIGSGQELIHLCWRGSFDRQLVLVPNAR